MSEPDFDEQLFRLAVRLGQERLRAVADYAEWWCRRRGASGVFGDDIEPRHLWDEFRHDTQTGPAEALEWAWDYDLKFIIRDRLNTLGETERSFVALAAQFQQGEAMRDLLHAFRWNSDIAEAAVMAELRSKAGE